MNINSSFIRSQVYARRLQKAEPQKPEAPKTPGCPGTPVNNDPTPKTPAEPIKEMPGSEIPSHKELTQADKELLAKLPTREAIQNMMNANMKTMFNLTPTKKPSTQDIVNNNISENFNRFSD